ncbi:MFS general substrate transporter [Exidia glandulosa HHB12029]|uniref:MFS general substrate transporter n=1 Tax=Exidia glandulosa HHB12029 TaxID=1314781 RepID=A0A165FAW9_EXIGL|nr:MFS general substrate transporter [Exidia glandulosa HHB12029]
MQWQDTGFAAYSYLFANFVIQFLAWSYAFSYAVFLPYYRDVLFRDHANISLLSLIGTLATGIMYVNALVVMRICPRYPWIKRPMMLAGLLTATLALVGAAFATEPWQLVLTQGVMFSVGGSFLYYPASSLLMEWFVKRRGLANGIIFSGTGIGGVVVPFMVNALLHKYGKRTTFLVMVSAIAAAVMCGCTLPVLPLLKSRLPDRSASARQAAKINYSVFKSIPLWCLIVSNWMQSMGHSIPLLWLPTFASDMHLSGLSGVLVIALLNGASVPGRIFMGYCSDHYDLRIPMLLTSVAPALGVLFLWGFTSNLALLVVFAVYHGFLGGGFSSMWPRFVSSVAKDDPHTSSFLLATFYAGMYSSYLRTASS